MITGRSLFLLAGLAIVGLLAVGCTRQPTEPVVVPSPTIQPTLKPRPTLVPLPTETATPDLPQVSSRWQPAGQGIPAQIGVAGIAVAPSDPLVIYLAACEPGGIYRSDDGGQTWYPANGGLETLAPITLGVHPGPVMLG